MEKTSEDNIGKKALKAGLGYTVGNVLVKGLSFISVFIFARLMTVADFGIFSTYNADASILFVVIGFALHASIRNANIDYHERIDEYCSSVTIPTILNTLFLLLVAILFARPLAALLTFERPSLVVMIVFESFCLAIITYYNSVLSVNYRYREYLFISLIYSLVGIGLSILLILTAFRSERYLGRVLGTLISSGIVTAYILFRIFQRARPRINTEFWRYGLKISLPIVPHGLSQILLSSFDRLMIKAQIGDTQAGIYSFAYTVGTIFTVVGSSLDTAWAQWFYDQMEKKNLGKIRRVASIYGTLMSAAAIMFMLISPELVAIMGGAKYLDSRAVTLPVILAMYYSFMYNFPASIEYYYKKTKFIAIGTMSAAALNIVLNAIFIPRYGYVAAAYTTVVCYLCYYGLHIFFSAKVHGDALYDMRVHLLLVALVSVSMFVILLFLESMWVRLGLLCAFLAAGLILTLRNRDEVLAVIRQFRK